MAAILNCFSLKLGSCHLDTFKAAYLNDILNIQHTGYYYQFLACSNFSESLEKYPGYGGIFDLFMSN